MTKRSRIASLAFSITALFVFAPDMPAPALDFTGDLFNPCKPPAVINTSRKPNVLLITDYSLSMQFPAYFGPGNIDEGKADNFCSSASGVVDGECYNNRDTAFTSCPEPYNACCAQDPRPAGCTACGTGGCTPYEPTKTYLGIFEPDVYYWYNRLNNYFERVTTQPVTTYTITARSADGGLVSGKNTIEFTAAGSSYAVNDIVVVKGLTSHRSLNSRGHKVLAATPPKFKIEGKWSGVADKENVATVVKRLNTGTFVGPTAVGVCGNIFNFLTASRLDAVLKVLIGGRKDYAASAADGSGDYLKGITARSKVKDNYNLFVEGYVRPTDTLPTSTTPVPDDWNTPNDSFLSKTTALSLKGKFTSSLLNTVDPSLKTKSGNKNQYCEVWTFTATGPTYVEIDMTSAWAANRGVRLVIHDSCGELSSGDDIKLVAENSNGQTVTLSGILAPPSAGYTYYLRVSSGGGAVLVNPNAGYTLWANVPLKKAVQTDCGASPDLKVANHQGVSVTPIEAVPWARVRLKTAKDSRKGIVQEVFDYVNFGFMFYNDREKACTEGKILYGFHEKDKAKLIAAFEGYNGPDVSNPYSADGCQFSSVYPADKTPTDEALQEVEEYFSQRSNSNNATNDSFLDPINNYATCLSDGTDCPSPIKDPYGVACRESALILISDGRSTTNDPGNRSRTIHTEDLRKTHNPLPGGQCLDLYTIYSLSTDPVGRNQMITMAAFGSFKEGGKKPCELQPAPMPFGLTSNDAQNSAGVTWPVCQKVSGKDECCCDPNIHSNCPAGATYMAGCSEWDKIWDRDNDGTLEHKGYPDTFFDAKDGVALENALRTVFDEIRQRTAAASSVATISQRVVGQDVILRGAFRAADKASPDKYLWYGHLEVYWPFVLGGEWKYSFEMPCNQDRLCVEMPGLGFGTCAPERYCWDAGEYLVNTSTAWQNRKILTWVDQNSNGQIRDPSTGATETDEWRTLAQIRAAAADLTKLRTESFDGLKDCVAPVGTIDNADLVALLNYSQGDPTNEDDPSRTGAKCYRAREDKDDPFGDRAANTPGRPSRWLMGDLVYSTPVIAGVPPLGAVAMTDKGDCYDSGTGKCDKSPAGSDVEGYWKYRNKMLDRLKTDNKVSSPTISQVVKQLVYVGANDGMIHAYVVGVWDWGKQKWIHDPNDSDVSDAGLRNFIGTELWAYMPSSALSDLPKLADVTYATTSGTCKHRTLMDLSPQVRQVYIKSDQCKTYSTDVKKPWEYGVGANSRCWRTIVLGGQRGGGDVYFAIDVTDPDQPKLLWEYSVLKDLVYYNKTTSSWAKPSEVATYYDGLRKLPLSWSGIATGRLYIPEGVDFYTGEPAGRLQFMGLPEVNGFRYRHVAFMGGGFRVFDSEIVSDTSVTLDSGTADSPGLLRLLRRPHMLAIDIETGRNLFKYVWPWVHKEDGTAPIIFPEVTRGSYFVPYAMAEPNVLDLCDSSDKCIGSSSSGGDYTDGYVDNMFMGDLTGYFYAIKLIGFNPPACDASYTAPSNKGMWIDLHVTKYVDESILATAAWSDYRGVGHPITSQPAVSVADDNKEYVHIVFGTGKFDDVGGDDDKTDPAKTSIYNLKKKIDKTMGTETKRFAPEDNNTNLNIWVKDACPTITNRLTSYNTGCTWMILEKDADNNVVSRGDCCENDCTSSCWSCVYDFANPATPADPITQLNPGERSTARALIAGGLAFVTTYIPASQSSRDCEDVGSGRLYALDYQCKGLRPNYNPVEDLGLTHNMLSQTLDGTTQNFGVAVDLGAGMPSSPVLDSAGENVIIQLSNAELLRVDVNLTQTPTQLKAWKEAPK
jgi:type IV pilus assembly protein PilY1